jgi:hypothetical protein
MQEEIQSTERACENSPSNLLSPIAACSGRRLPMRRVSGLAIGDSGAQAAK